MLTQEQVTKLSEEKGWRKKLMEKCYNEGYQDGLKDGIEKGKEEERKKEKLEDILGGIIDPWGKGRIIKIGFSEPDDMTSGGYYMESEGITVTSMENGLLIIAKGLDRKLI